MSSITHGWSGLALAYAAVELPFAATLIRRGADFGKVIASTVVAAPLTMVAGIGTAVMNPLLRGIGISHGSFLETGFGVAVTVGVGYAAARLFSRPAAPMSIHQRGAIVEDSNQSGPGAGKFGVRGQAAERSSQRSAGTDQRCGTLVTLAGIPVSHLDETKHFKLIGTTGTGKSTAIRELLSSALERGDRAIIADPDGGYLARFKDSSRGDLVLNPFDPASRKWDLFGEINNPYDIDQLARSLIPDPSGTDKVWTGYARTFFTAVTRQAHEAGVTDVRELYNLLVVADVRELRGFLAGTAAQPFLEEHNGRMFDSIRSVTSSAVASLDYIAQQTTSPLSVRQWVREGYAGDGSSGRSGETSPGGVLFIPYKAGQIAALRSNISAWMRLAIFESMSQPEGDQRLWFVVDELDALGQIDGLKDALARLRKFGGRCVLGFQSIAQVSSTYGKGEAQTIVENCGNTLILRCSGSEHGGTAHFASQLIGQREVLRTQRSRSRRATEFLSSTTLSEHLGIEPAVMDSEIEQLPDLSGYLKFASQPNWQRITLSAPDRSRDAEGPVGSSIRTDARNSWHEWRASTSAPGRQGGALAPTPAHEPRAGKPAARDAGPATPEYD